MGEIVKGNDDLKLIAGTTSGSGGTDVAAIIDVRVGSSQEAKETTAADCTDGWRTYAVGLKEPGEISGTINFLPANATHKNASGGLLYRFNHDSGDASAVQEYTVQWPDAASTTVYGDAILTTFNVSASIGEKVTADFTLKFTGAPTWG